MNQRRSAETHQLIRAPTDSEITSTDYGATMQNDTKRSMRPRRHGPAIGPVCGHSKGSERKLNTPEGIRFIDAKGSYERYMGLARAARSAGDAIEIENYYQHAEHYFRLMNEHAV
jgi:hypothetical protein